MNGATIKVKRISPVNGTKVNVGSNGLKIFRLKSNSPEQKEGNSEVQQPTQLQNFRLFNQNSNFDKGQQKKETEEQKPQLASDFIKSMMNQNKSK